MTDTVPTPDAQPAKEPKPRTCKWVNDSQFNLASWVAGKLRATIEIYDIPGVGSMTATFRELSEDEVSEIDAIIANERMKFWNDEGLFRYRNLACAAMATVAIDGKPWPGSEKTLALKEQVDLFRKARGRGQLDLVLKAYGDFMAQLVQMLGGVDPKLFASPSGASVRA